MLKKMLHVRKKQVSYILHPYLPITANSLQRLLSSVPNVAVVGRFNCDGIIRFVEFIDVTCGLVHKLEESTRQIFPKYELDAV